jgi:uracil DNA glycosylase
MLAQGVLFLNASLTIGPKEEGKRGGALHTKFWKPVVECIIDQILEERKGKGIVVGADCSGAGFEFNVCSPFLIVRI